MVSDYNFLSRQWTINGRTGTFKRISNETTKTLDDPIRKGIDGVYEFSNPGQPPPPPRFVVNDAKFGVSQLGRQATKSGGSQMTKKWIKWNLRKDFDDDMVLEIMKGYDSVVTRVANDGSATLGKLNDAAVVINKNWPN